MIRVAKLFTTDPTAKQRLVREFAWAAIAALILAARASAELPAGTVIEVRLLTPVSSYSSKPGAEVRGLVVPPVCPQVGGTVPAGTSVLGIVKRVRKVGLGLVHESARVELEFHELQLPDGGNFPLRARLLSVDNARERVDQRGAIHGIRATASLSHRFGSRLGFAALGHPIGLIPIFIIESGLFRFPNPEIDYGVGTELHLELQNSLALGAAADCVVTPEVSHDEADELQHLVAKVPYWTYSKRQRTPMDPTNLVFIASQEELDRAFTAAGWSGSQSLSVATGLQTMRAIAESRAYPAAPMKTLLLDGAAPEISRQKTLNTLTKRHHLRIWKRPDEWRGRTVWAAAATRDISAGFSLRPFGFTHQIQNEVDLERHKVISDLVFTGCVESVAYCDRSEAMRFSASQDRKGVRTDSRVAVVVLNACNLAGMAGPTSFVAAENLQPSLAVRCVRRVTLTARNHLIRDHLIWRVGDAARMGFLAVRNRNQQRRSERPTTGKGRDVASFGSSKPGQ